MQCRVILLIRITYRTLYVWYLAITLMVLVDTDIIAHPD